MINFGAAPLGVLELILTVFDSLIIGKERGASYFTIHLSMFLVSEEKFTPML